MSRALWMGRRFTFAGGREARARLVLNAVGVALGVTLVLLSLTALPAIAGRDHRSAWHTTTATTAPTAVDHALWQPTFDHFLGRDLFVVRVAALGAHPPVPPGLARLPGPGEVVVSPALHDLLAATPPDVLAARLPGRLTGVLAPAGLAYPEELVAVVGRTPDELRAVGAMEVSGIATTAPGALDNPSLRVIFTIGAIGLLLPVVAFIGTAARVSAARREQRYAALRLVGATRGQVVLMATTETAFAALAGAAAGWLGYLVARPVIAARVTFEGSHFIAEDVHAPAAQQALILLAAPLLCAAATVLSLRRAQVTPLGVRRRTRTRNPGWWRLLPVVAGVAGLVTIAATDLTNTTRSDVATAQLLIGGTFAALLLGLILAGPLLCARLARLLSRASRRLPELMAARRIAADPYTTFRAISGVAIAALVATMFAGAAGGVEANLDRPDPDALRVNAIEILLRGRPDPALLAAVGNAPGVHRTVVARQRPDATNTLAVSCPDLAAAVNIACPGPPSPFGRIPPGLAGITRLDPADPGLPAHAIYVVTDDAPTSVERVRSLAAALSPGSLVSTGRDLVELDRRQLTELQAGLQLAMLFVLLVATASLTVGVAAGLVDRRRPFALLRATGIHLGELRRMVLIETALPLAVTTVTGVALGLLASYAASSSEAQRWAPPGPAFLATILAGLLITLTVAAGALPLLRRVTEHNAVRFE